MLRLSFPLSLAQLPMTADLSGQRPHGALTGTGDQNTPSPSSKLHVHLSTSLWLIKGSPCSSKLRFKVLTKAIHCFVWASCWKHQQLNFIDKSLFSLKTWDQFSP